MDKISSVDNINKYIKDLIMKDILDNRTFHFINNDVMIDFELSPTLNDLINKAEKADLYNDYGLYMNLVDAIDSQAKKETTKHIISESQWNKLMRRYLL